MNSESDSSFESEIRELQWRVEQLEEALVRQRILDAEWLRAVRPDAVESAEPARVEVDPAVVPVQPAPVKIQPPIFASVTAGAAEPDEGPQSSSLERKIASQWFNRIGILAVLIGMAWFLKLAFDNRWIGPLGRVLIGLAAGAGLIAWSERFRAKGYVAFSYSLKATGGGILYLSLWAAFSVYHLIPGAAAFAAMIAVTAFHAFLSWIQESELLALYAIAGGFCTPVLVSTGENHQISLFSYILVLDLAVLVLVTLRPWSRLLFCAFLGTVLYVLGWSVEFYTREQAGRTAVFFAAFFLVFALAPRLVLLHTAADETAAGGSAWDGLVTVAMPLFVAALGFLAFYSLLNSVEAHRATPWLAVLFAGFYLLLMRLPECGRWRKGSVLLAQLHLATAVVFLTIAIPLKASGRWITIGWFAEAAALMLVAARTRSILLRVFAVLCLLIALVALIANPISAGLTPIFNERFATYLVAIGAFAAVTWIAVHAEKEERDDVLRWPAIALISGLLINALILLSISLEVHAYWWHLRWHGQETRLEQYKMYAQFTYSAFFMTFGAVLLALGFWRNAAFLRWQALILLAVSIGKVFLVDVSELSQGYRIVSFLGLGALLLAVSFVYQRDLFNLRHRGDGSA
jgi:uncharacterized membrane protein